MRLTASKPGMINFKMSMQTGQTAPKSGGTDDTLIVSGNNRPFSGNGVTVPAALKYQTRAKILHDRRQADQGHARHHAACRARGAAAAAHLRQAAGRRPWRSGRWARRRRRARRFPVEYSVEGADSATILIASATSYKNFQDTSADPNALAAAIIDKASAKGYDAIRKDQLADHQKMFDRVSLDLGANADAKLPTDQRIRNFPQSNDPALVSLYFQYGRFLLIGSLAPRRAAGQSAGHLEQRHEPVVGQQVHDQHQHRDELLAGQQHQPRRMH